MASVHFATEEKNDAKPVWERHVSGETFSFSAPQGDRLREHGNDKYTKNKTKMRGMRAPCDDIADILLANRENPPVWPDDARLSFMDKQWLRQRTIRCSEMASCSATSVVKRMGSRMNFAKFSSHSSSPRPLLAADA